MPFHLQKKAVNIFYLLLFIYAYSLSMFIVDLSITNRITFIMVETLVMTIAMLFVFYLWFRGKMDIAIFIAGLYGVGFTLLIFFEPLSLRFYMQLSMVLLVTFLGYRKAYQYIVTALIIGPLTMIKMINDQALRSNNHLKVLLSMVVIGILLYYIKRIFDSEIEASDRLRHIQETDPLTQMPNRRSFENNIKDNMHSDQEAHMMLIDLDHFKRINDKYGHHIGDQVLVQFSQVLKTKSDEESYAFRWGGEEFAVLCYKTEADSYNLAESIRIAFENTSFCVDERITVSIGLSNVTKLHSEENDYIIRADKALYEAKSSGRNKTITLIK